MTTSTILYLSVMILNDGYKCCHHKHATVLRTSAAPSSSLSFDNCVCRATTPSCGKPFSSMWTCCLKMCAPSPISVHLDLRRKLIILHSQREGRCTSWTAMQATANLQRCKRNAGGATSLYRRLQHRRFFTAPQVRAVHPVARRHRDFSRRHWS